MPPGDPMWRLRPSTVLELPAPLMCSHTLSLARVTVSLPCPCSTTFLSSSAPHIERPPVKPAWPSCAHGFRGSPQPADTAAPGRGPCLHAHHTERSAGLSRSSDGFLFLSLCSACLGCVPLSNTWLGSLGGRVPPGVSVPAQESARAYQRRQERNVCLLHASAFPPA